MNYVGLFTDHHIAMLHDWLTEIGELFMDFSYPHSGGSGSNYFVRSLDDVRGAVQKQWHPEIEIMIFRAIVFPVRGKNSSVLLQEALQKIPDDQYYQIVTPDPYPNQCLPLADGKGHEQLRFDLTNLDLGHEVAIGVHPFDVAFDEFD